MVATPATTLGVSTTAVAVERKRGSRTLKGSGSKGGRASFSLQSLQGRYAYNNHISNIGSYGIMYFDGMGGIAMDDLRVNRPGENLTQFFPITALGREPTRFIQAVMARRTCPLKALVI